LSSDRAKDGSAGKPGNGGKASTFRRNPTYLITERKIVNRVAREQVKLLRTLPAAVPAALDEVTHDATY
jgi:hypothetical protein